MAKTISVEVVTPDRLALREEADFVVLPGSEGQLGVLPGHAPLLAQLEEGELKIVKGGDTRYFAISGGFAEVHAHKVEVFAETAELAAEINVERARMAAEKAKRDIAGKSASPQDLAKAQAALRRALIRLRVSEGLSRRPRK